MSQGDLALPDHVLDSLCFISSCKKPRLLSANRKGIKKDNSVGTEYVPKGRKLTRGQQDGSVGKGSSC